MNRKPSLKYVQWLEVFLSFPDHQGIPGHQGGSLPRGEGAGASANQNPGYIKDNLSLLSGFKKFQGIEKPEIRYNTNGNNSVQFGRINIDKEAGSDQRIGKTFVHEYGHYADYKLSITDQEDFNKAFDESRKRVDNISSDDGLIGFASNALKQGQDGSQWHSREYFKQIKDADKKEFFAISLTAYVYYDPKYFKAFPEMLGYMKSLE